MVKWMGPKFAFDVIHQCLLTFDSRFKPQEPLIDVQAIVELASSFGPVAINRAYCNWKWYRRYRDPAAERDRTDTALLARLNLRPRM
jgi:hypothetical protein